MRFSLVMLFMFFSLYIHSNKPVYKMDRIFNKRVIVVDSIANKNNILSSTDIVYYSWVNNNGEHKKGEKPLIKFILHTKKISDEKLSKMKINHERE